MALFAGSRKRLPVVHVELDPGDTVFFHSNLLHTSEANVRQDQRWTLICCFNAMWNDPFDDQGEHPRYSHLERWPDDRILEIGHRR